jgi:hypothetical protein
MGVLSYGGVGGTRAAEHPPAHRRRLQMADARTNVALSLITDFQEFTQARRVRINSKPSKCRSTRSSPAAKRWHHRALCVRLT